MSLALLSLAIVCPTIQSKAATILLAASFNL